MKEFIDKLISELKEEHERCINRYGVVGGNKPAMEVKQCMVIVNELAEEYKVSEMPTGWIIGGKGIHKQTNADRIRSMTDEELAEFIRKTIWNEGSELFDCSDLVCHNACWKCDMYLKWLQSEAE